MDDWIFTRLDRGWAQAEDGTPADSALRAQLDTDVRGFLADNFARLVDYYDLTPGMADVARALVAVDTQFDPVSRRQISGALRQDIQPSNLVTRL